MAEVLLPATTPPTMLHARNPSSDSFNMSGQPYQSPTRSHTPRTVSYNSQTGTPVSQRSTSGPVQPYAFKATPQLKLENRPMPAAIGPTVDSPQSVSGPTLDHMSFEKRQSSKGTPSNHSRTSSTKEPLTPVESAFDRPASVIQLSASVPDLTLTSFDTTPKSSPNRYRRSPQRVESAQDLHQQPATPTSNASTGDGLVTASPSPSPVPSQSQIGRSPEAAKRYRRRSSNTLDTARTSTTSLQHVEARRSSVVGNKHDGAASTIRPVSGHTRNTSTTSTHSRSHSYQSIEDESTSRQRSSAASNHSNDRDASPARSSRNADMTGKRLSTPSPLSQTPYNTQQQTLEGRQPSQAPAASPAVQQLAALSDKDLNKGMKSRLRRAFSFGSAAELRKASAGTENSVPPSARPTDSNYDEEQAEIVRKQEAAGIGAGIYSGQGGFAGSIDNLSISSTASSASLMLRKMGTKMKKGGRSMKGLFRPKSVIGVPAADGPFEAPEAHVSMVTVEAERQSINVNPQASGHVDGATDFPRLENNSIEARQPTPDSMHRDGINDAARKSIVGSDIDRQEVLAAVKKGILKRSATSSPTGSPQLRPQVVTSDLHRPDSPASSVRDERQSHSLTSNASSSDYFHARSGNSGGHGRSMPPTPVSQRNITFSPRIQFYDVWSSNEYDRRGDIATCNRLTPMLAQQIKEELNTLKMVSLTCVGTLRTAADQITGNGSPRTV